MIFILHGSTSFVAMIFHSMYFMDPQCTLFGGHTSFPSGHGYAYLEEGSHLILWFLLAGNLRILGLLDSSLIRLSNSFKLYNVFHSSTPLLPSHIRGNLL